MEYRVDIPEERFRVLELEMDELPGIVVVNQNLDDFEPKAVFAWHLRMTIDYQDVGERGMPTPEEKHIVDDFGDRLDAVFKGDPEHPNALFLARMTWNGTRELVYRVYEPEPIAAYLNGIIEAGSQIRPFDFEMQPDAAWELAKWYSTMGVKAE